MFFSDFAENIKVRFFEYDRDEQVIWEDWGKFTEADVHHQYAIALKTPPYRKTNIEESVSTKEQLILSLIFIWFFCVRNLFEIWNYHLGQSVDSIISAG